MRRHVEPDVAATVVAFISQSGGGWVWRIRDHNGTLHTYRTDKRGEGVERYEGDGRWTRLAWPAEYALPLTWRSARDHLRKATRRGRHY